MKILLTLLLLILPGAVSAQNLKFQHGVSLSLYFGNELKYLISYNPNVSYPIGNNRQAIVPMLDLKLALYNNNLGSSVLKSFRNKVHFNLAFSPTVSYSFTEANPNNPGYIPIFSNTIHGTANTDYDNNIGFSVVYIWQCNFGGGIKKRSISQRLGNLFASTKYVFLHYYNDGGPVNKWLGDKKDRYWTGGGTIGTKFTYRNNIQYLMITFDKYSGFNKNAYEASGLLYTDNVNYKDMNETTYNTGKYSIKYLNPSLNFGAAINHWNTAFDFQDFIHRDISSSPYHFKLKKPYFDFEIITLYED